jgi:hypothetical protein
MGFLWRVGPGEEGAEQASRLLDLVIDNLGTEPNNRGGSEHRIRHSLGVDVAGKALWDYDDGEAIAPYKSQRYAVQISVDSMRRPSYNETDS